jgi:hypothetical protein
MTQPFIFSLHFLPPSYFFIISLKTLALASALAFDKGKHALETRGVVLARPPVGGEGSVLADEPVVGR